MPKFFLEGLKFGKHVQPLVVIVPGLVSHPLFLVLLIGLVRTPVAKGHGPLIAPIKIELVQFAFLDVRQFLAQPALVLDPQGQDLVGGLVGILGGIEKVTVAGLFAVVRQPFVVLVPFHLGAARVTCIFCSSSGGGRALRLLGWRIIVWRRLLWLLWPLLVILRRIGTIGRSSIGSQGGHGRIAFGQ